MACWLRLRIHGTPRRIQRPSRNLRPAFRFFAANHGPRTAYPCLERQANRPDRRKCTDGLIPALDLVVLEDDRHYFPPYEAVSIIRKEALARHPEIGQALDELAGKISDDDMRQLNYAVDGQHRDAKEVVREFLRRKGLVR